MTNEFIAWVVGQKDGPIVNIPKELKSACPLNGHPIVYNVDGSKNRSVQIKPDRIVYGKKEFYPGSEDIIKLALVDKRTKEVILLLQNGSLRKKTYDL